MSGLTLRTHLSSRSNRFSTLGLCTVRSLLIRAEAPEESNPTSNKSQYPGCMVLGIKIQG